MAVTQKQVRQFLLVGGGIFAITMAYGSGMRAQVPKLKQAHKDFTVYRQEARIGQLAVRGQQVLVHQLEARRLLDVAETARERGDPGAAQAAIAEAITRLETAQAADAATGLDFARVIADLKEVSSPDVDTTKSLRDVAATMDAQFKESNTLPAPDALAPITIDRPTDNEKPTLGNDVTRVK
ncbi:MAG: hypothetical protein H7Y38_16300 [Armatimonadetes bacterium]|nr:hypothetical protein [Armatimonadota bacterium]